MNPGKLALVLVGPSARAEGTVVLDVLRTRTRTRNTCNAKSVGWRSTYRAGPSHPEKFIAIPLRLRAQSDRGQSVFSAFFFALFVGASKP